MEIGLEIEEASIGLHTPLARTSASDLIGRPVDQQMVNADVHMWHIR